MLVCLVCGTVTVDDTVGHCRMEQYGLVQGYVLGSVCLQWCSCVIVLCACLCECAPMVLFE